MTLMVKENITREVAAADVSCFKELGFVEVKAFTKAKTKPAKAKTETETVVAAASDKQDDANGDESK